MKRVGTIFVYWYFLNKGFVFHAGNGCYDLLRMSRNLSVVTILNIENVDYC